MTADGAAARPSAKSDAVAQPVEQPLRGPYFLPRCEALVDRGPGRKVHGQGAPRDAVVDHVQDRVHDQAAAVLFPPPTTTGQTRRIGQQRVQLSPLGVGDVGGIPNCPSCGLVEGGRAAARAPAMEPPAGMGHDNNGTPRRAAPRQRPIYQEFSRLRTQRSSSAQARKRALTPAHSSQSTSGP